MQLTVGVRCSAQMTEFTCRGRVTQGEESDYLFDLLTRRDNRDVFLDLEAVEEFDYTGLLTIVVCQEHFSSQQRRLVLRLPSAITPASGTREKEDRQLRSRRSNLGSWLMQKLGMPLDHLKSKAASITGGL